MTFLTHFIKKNFLNLQKFILLVIFLIPNSDHVYTQTQTPIYLTFITHNEDAEPYNTNFNYYILRRNIIVQLADYVQSHNVKWDFQSDWRFLLGVRNFDTGSVILNTNGKNIIKWLTEDKGIECDPHAHENAYNYADVAYLHTQLGIIPNKIVGGFLYNQIINGNNWENLEIGIYGRVYTSYFWKPDILWGGGTQNHVNDPLNYGAWKPQSMANYYYHDTSKHLTLIGNGCANKIFDTTLVTTAVNRVRNIINAVSYGLVPDTGFYTSTVFMGMGQFNIAQLNKMKQFIDSVSVFVAQGKIQWKSLNEIYEIWNTDYNKKPFWIQCAQIPEVYSVINISSIPEGFYNEVNNSLNLRDTVTAYLRSTTSPYSIVDSSKRKVDSLTFTGSFAFLNANSGIYYVALKHRNSIETWSKNGGLVFSRGSVMNYNFTTAQSQAYGNNLVLKADKYCAYSGDVDQDGIIDANDMSFVDNDAFIFASGYLSTDVNGDGIIDANDLSITDNNTYKFISIIRP